MSDGKKITDQSRNPAPKGESSTGSPVDFAAKKFRRGILKNSGSDSSRQQVGSSERSEGILKNSGSDFRQKTNSSAKSVRFAENAGSSEIVYESPDEYSSDSSYKRGYEADKEDRSFRGTSLSSRDSQSSTAISLDDVNRALDETTGREDTQQHDLRQRSHHPSRTQEGNADTRPESLLSVSGRAQLRYERQKEVKSLQQGSEPDHHHHAERVRLQQVVRRGIRVADQSLAIIEKIRDAQFEARLREASGEQLHDSDNARATTSTQLDYLPSPPTIAPDKAQRINEWFDRVQSNITDDPSRLQKDRDGIMKEIKMIRKEEPDAFRYLCDEMNRKCSIHEFWEPFKQMIDSFDPPK